MPALIAVAHGSRDPRSAATMSAVVAELSVRRPDLDVRLAFLDLNTPSVEQVVDAVAAQGHSAAVVVPLLLGRAFHARVDLPGLLAAARARHPRLRLTQADVLGADPRLVTALRERVLAAGGDPADEGTGVAIAAVGSSSPEANRRTERLGGLLSAGTAWHTEVCFATTEPSLPQAVSRLRARGCHRILVAPWFLAPGLLTDRLRKAAPSGFISHTGTDAMTDFTRSAHVAPATLAHAAPIGPHPLLTEVVLARYTQAIPPVLDLTA
ncbi:sirohydrochlorin chelatase [Nocardia blacklockiae]|uniref:sirohydrochlorin chelatase n=1 Tax=Nocardia blacklockiae TaxID=480036 RepID=UPI0018938AC4|nr:sirohydrochlorin chelatase [Nocardia blacklockiae]MBF6172267.1 sirohydrochlorin chelatase [Nocardia blacklockiae]